MLIFRCCAIFASIFRFRYFHAIITLHMMIAFSPPLLFRFSLPCRAYGAASLLIVAITPPH